MDIINKFCLVISIIFVFGFIINPPWHKIFRDKKTYTIFLYFFIIFPIVSFLTLFGEIQNPKISVSITLYPVIFLVLHKYFDNRIVKKYNRHLIFSKQFNVLWKDDESDNATSTDNWFQFLICFTPLILLYGFGLLVFEAY